LRCPLAGSFFCRHLIERGGPFVHLLSLPPVPLSIARAHDLLDGQGTVAVSAGFLLAFSIGGCLGPLLASAVMAVLKNPFGLFCLWSLTHIAFAAAIFYFKAKEKVVVVPVEDQVAFVPMKSTTLVGMALDPRNETLGATQLNRQIKARA
jgi:hypothetical protein